jgi:uncharacterized membrane protein YadS
MERKTSFYAAKMQLAKRRRKKLPLPWYVLGFILFCLVNSVFSLPSIIDESAHFISKLVLKSLLWLPSAYV